MSEVLLFVRSMGWLLLAILALTALMVLFFGVEMVNGFLKLLVGACVDLAEED